MRVFVLCTGRCGSVTFAKACEHITNYTSGHESGREAYEVDGKRYVRISMGGDALEFPDRHIEVNPRFAWCVGWLDEEYGQEPFFVHLKRDWKAVEASFTKKLLRGNKGMPFGWGLINGGITTTGDDKFVGDNAAAIVQDMLSVMESNIRLFLKDKNGIEFNIENAKKAFPRFWEKIGATGNLDAALGEFDIRHNAGTYE